MDESSTGAAGPARTRAGSLRSGVVTLVFVALAALTVLGLQPGRVEPADSDPRRFSAARAMAHVRVLAAEPRPAGSAAHARARDYIVATLRDLGLTPEVLGAEAISTRYGLPFDSATLHNVSATLDGEPGSGEILLVAHYDTVPTSPGGADDAAGVATLLETARALTAGPRPRASVVLLFTDAEEIGAVGGEHFAAASGSGVERVVVNFDARGTRGPCGLVETGPNSGALVRALASLPFAPAASSLAPALARFHGLGTDFRPFREAGVRGLNFILLDGVAYYHTPRDDADALDPRSLQQQGDIAVAIVNTIGDPRTLPAWRDGTYFPVPGWGLVWLPWWCAIAAALVATLLGLLLGRRTWRAESMRASTAVAAFVALVLAVVAAAAAGQLVWWAVRAIDPTWSAMRTADTYAPGSYRLCVVFAAAAVTVACGRFAVRRFGLPSVVFACAALWLVFLWMSLAWAPGAAYLFAAPPAVLSLAFGRLRRRSGTAWARAVLCAVCVAPVAVLWGPMPYFVLLALQLSAAAGAALVVAIPTLVVLALFEAADLSTSWVSPLAAIAAIGLFAYGAVTASFDSARPYPVSLAFAADGDSHRAWWISDRAGGDAPTAPVLGTASDPTALPDFFAERDTIVRAADAPSVDLPGPEVTLLADENTSAGRVLTFRLRSRRDAPWLFAFIVSSSRVLGSSIDGSPVTGDAVAEPVPRDVRWGFRHVGLRPEGIVWSVTVEPSSERVDVVVVDQTPGTPAGGPRMTSDLMFARSWVSGTTLVRTAASF
jgi:hypothetical protein